MKIYRILLIASAFSMTACGAGNGSLDSDSALSASPGTLVNPQAFTTISLIELNDLHAHLTEHMDYNYANGGVSVVKRGGLARIATAIKDIRQENPYSIVMNIGDTYHGGVEALYTNGNAIVDPLNAMGIDIGVPGNWDYAYGPSVTRARFSEAGRFGNDETKKVNYDNLAANVTSTTPQVFLPATKIITMNGIDIGFIGLSSDIVPRMFSGFAIGFDFLQGKQNHIDLIALNAADLRSRGADVVVVMSELGIHKDIALADAIAVGQVDVFFSAHTHELTRDPIISNSGAMVVESGNDTFLGRMDLRFDDKNQLQDRQWSIIEIDSRFAEDEAIKPLVDNARQPFLASDVNIEFPVAAVSQRLTQPIDTVIAQFPYTVDRRQVLSNNFNQMFTQMLRQYAGTDIATMSGFRFGSVVPGMGFLLEDNALASGAMTLEDVYRFFPVTIELATASVTGEQLKEVIEMNLSSVFSTEAFDHSGGWFDGFNGLELDVSLKQDNGQRINSIRLVGSQSEILDNDIVSIAGCVRPIDPGNSDVLCGYSGFMNVVKLTNLSTGQPWSAIDFLYGTAAITASAEFAYKGYKRFGRNIGMA
ncbi:MAG: 5'-nucleotidase C-terminal domain-containing protein [Ectothiorhodospiraceae bacterium]|nr:5'-nucleotidase C-terminal domain-containing protein [Ectothiorhodospiraceae bacterium]